MHQNYSFSQRTPMQYSMESGSMPSCKAQTSSSQLSQNCWHSGNIAFADTKIRVKSISSTDIAFWKWSLFVKKFNEASVKCFNESRSFCISDNHFSLLYGDVYFSFSWLFHEKLVELFHSVWRELMMRRKYLFQFLAWGYLNYSPAW